MNSNLLSDKLELQGISVQYIYSACVITSTQDVKILHDPWFTEGIYDGSWFHYPKVEDPFNAIGDVDIIYVSHIHPDHYDGKFIKEYFKRYGTKKVVIANHTPNYLAGKMRSEGIIPTILEDDLIIGNTILRIVPHKTNSISDIDSAIIIKFKDTDRTHCVVNANDIIFDQSMREMLKNEAGDIDILLCGYTGAGPYPQTYFEQRDNRLLLEAEKKKQAFFERYMTLINHMNAKVNIPFAGKYILGGKLSSLNSFRGVADPVEVLRLDPRAVVLNDQGGVINTESLLPQGVRTEKYNSEDMEARIQEISMHQMDYERLIDDKEIYQLPLKRLLLIASKNAIAKSECDTDYYFCIKLPQAQYAVINANKSGKLPMTFLEDGQPLPEPRSEILIDPRYLFGLLTHVYHWNNAEVGSQYNTRRLPDVLNRKAQAFLNFLAL